MRTWWSDPTRTKELLDLIVQLPEACRWREAMHNDPEYAREALAYEDEHGDQSDRLWTPAWSEFDLSAIQQREVINLLRGIGEGLGILTGGRPFPAPATALDALKQQIADRDTAMLIAHMLGR